MFGEQAEPVPSSPVTCEPLEQRRMLSVTGANLTSPGTAQEGQAATFWAWASTDHDYLDPSGSAPTHWSVQWGDGSTDNFTIQNPQGAVPVYHTYPEELSGGSVTAYVWDDDVLTYGYTHSTTFTTTSIDVEDAPLSASGSTTQLVPDWDMKYDFGYVATYGGTLAVLTDMNGAAPLSDYSGSVLWSDGASSPLTFAADPAGGWDASAPRNFADPGVYTASITINDVGGSSATTQSTVTVGAPTGTIQQADFSANNPGDFHAVTDDHTDNALAPSEWVKGSHNWPICYTRSGTTDGDVYMKATGSFNVTNFRGDHLMVKATIDGQDTDPAPAGLNSDGTILTGAVTSKVKIPSTIDYRPAETISWKISPDNGVTWIDGGSTSDRMYVVNANALTKDEALDTVLLVGCSNAKGLTPATGDVVSAIWNGSFAGRNIKEPDGRVMKYWGTYATNNPVFDTEGLVKNADGRCDAWAHFMIDVLGAQGVSSIYTQVVDSDPYTPTAGYSFYALQLTTKTAQGGDASTDAFNGYAVVMLPNMNSVYDPSYGQWFPDAQHWRDHMELKFVFQDSNGAQWSTPHVNGTADTAFNEFP